MCLEDFRDGDDVSPMPCDVRHVFHYKCLKVWLKKNNNTEADNNGRICKQKEIC